MATRAASAATLLARAEQAWADGDGAAAMTWFDRAADAAESEDDLDARAAALLGLARGQQYNLTPGSLPVRLHAAYDAADEPRLRARLAAALARCWAYANEPRRARPFAVEALHLADQEDDPVLQADALDAGLATHWGPDDLALRREWVVRLGDTAAHLPDPAARLQAHLWSLTVAWEGLDLPRMHRSMRDIELLASESPRAAFFAASRRLPLELLRGRLDVVPLLVERASAAAEAAVIPDGEPVLHSMRGYSALFSGDPDGCAAEAPAFEEYGVELGVASVRAEAAMMWLGAGRPDKVVEMIAAFTPDVLAGLPRDSDWLLTLQCVLEAALFVGDAEVAGSVVALLAPYAGRSVVNAGAVMWHGVTDDTLARAYSLLGDADAAARHRGAALATYERVGAAWWRDRLLALVPESSAPAVHAGVVTVYLQQQPGGLWLVGREGATFVLPRLRGLAHLHTLISRPGVDIPAVELVGGHVEQPAMEVLDDESRRVLSARLRDLDAELELTDRPDLREERDAVAAYLAGGTALAGRNRTTGSNAERARIAVRKAIVAALAKIAEVDPWVGRHLHDHVHTGLVCSYELSSDDSVRWSL